MPCAAASARGRRGGAGGDPPVGDAGAPGHRPRGFDGGGALGRRPRRGAGRRPRAAAGGRHRDRWGSCGRRGATGQGRRLAGNQASGLDPAGHSGADAARPRSVVATGARGAAKRADVDHRDSSGRTHPGSEGPRTPAGRAPASADRSLPPAARVGRSRRRTPYRRRSCGRGGRSTGSRAGRRCERGCTALPRMCASTCGRHATPCSPGRFHVLADARVRCRRRTVGRGVHPTVPRLPCGAGRRRPGRPGGDPRGGPRGPSSRPFSTCRSDSGRSCYCARSCAGRRARLPNCSEPPWRRSTARSNGLGRTSLPVDVQPDRPHRLDEEQRPLVQHYVDAFERHDVDSLVSLLV